MKIAHVSDVHLGYKAYSRLTDQGINQREQDVFDAFRAALVEIEELDPDIVIIAGDLFHTVRPNNRTIIYAFRLLFSFQQKRKEKPTFIIAGNHETPKTREQDCILKLFAKISSAIHVCFSSIIKYENYEHFNLLAIPAAGIYVLPKTVIEPDSNKPVNILTLHGLLGDVARTHSDNGITSEQILNDNWDYIALGDYHVHKVLRPNAAYSGSLEYTSSNIWEEASQPKGFILYDTDTKELSFKTINTRKVIDLPIIDAAKEDPQIINDKIADNAENDKIDIGNAVVRQVIINAPIGLSQILDKQRINKLKERALYYQLDIKTKNNQPSRASNEIEPPTDHISLTAEWSSFIEREYKENRNKQAIMELGLSLLNERTEEQQDK